MLTTAISRVAVVTVAFATFAATASSAGAQSTAAQAATPAMPTTTGAIPIAPTQPAPTQSESPAAPPATTAANADQAASKPSDTTAAQPKATEPPASAVANAATPAAPETLAVTPAVTPPAATTPVAPPAAAAATTTPVAPAVPTTTPTESPAAPSAAQSAPAAGATAPVAAGVPALPAAEAAPAVPPAAAAAAPPPAPPVDPVIQAVRTWLDNSANTAKSNKEDVAAAVAFYGSRTAGPLWVEGTAFNARAKGAMDEVRKADDWGLSAAAFDLPALVAGSSSPDALAAAEGKLSLELLKYVRHARGGRVNLASLSRILDQKPPLKDPTAVMAELAVAASPDAYLRDQHPKHPQFQLLQKALLKARGPTEPVAEIDPALTINLPATREMLKVGVEHPNIALLRQRMKVPAEAGTNETMFDEKLEIALKAYQAGKGLQPSGELTGATRKTLNSELVSNKPHDPERGTQLIVLNMERWRWLPEDLGAAYVWNNIPEYETRTYKGDELLFKERIIVGLPEWATPVFSESMKTIVFNPSWGMPDGIKTRELAPRLRAAGGGDFFSQLFGGGGGGGASIRAHGLDVYRNGQKIDPDSVNWGNADLRAYSFIQPPGPKNPLGTVKFLFPNRHDVYMHDTIERSLFAQPSRALSHGCIRVQNPRRFAEVMIMLGNGVSEDEAGAVAARGGDVKLKNPVPVHNTYMTAVVDANGRVSTFRDLYGYDSRLSQMLTGRATYFDPGPQEVVASDDYTPSQPAQQSGKKKKGAVPAQSLEDLISGIWLN